MTVIGPSHSAASVAPMERLADEVIQLVFDELTDPGPLTMTSRRFYEFSKAAYVRAHYFLVHYGPAEAMFYALGRGKVLTEQVIDILLSSGAHLSRYLVQIAMHHYFYTQAHFIRTPWVRSVPLGVFVYFMQVAQARYGDIPRGKGEDDGSLFMAFLKENRFPSHLRSVTWENIMEILEKYKFMPFSNKDPIMAQFPLILAIEPRLLPAAVANGFRMDYKYRDFVFRKMFERHTGEIEASDVARNIRELCKLDPTMFVSRTVAAEVCMEAKYNDVGYGALKQLDKSGHLRFDLRTLVADLLKTFLNTRAISHSGTGDILRQLYSDYPSTNPAVRLVVIISIFIAAESSRSDTQQIHSNLEAAGLTPLSRNDMYNVLINPFVEKYAAVIDYASEEVGMSDLDGEKGMSGSQIDELIQEVARKCLEIGCKGKLLNRLLDGFPTVRDVIFDEVLERHQIRLEDVPLWEDRDSSTFTALLSRDYARLGPVNIHALGQTRHGSVEEGASTGIDHEYEGEGGSAGGESLTELGVREAQDLLAFDDEEHETPSFELGEITQESLTNMIRQDELAPSRSRSRRWLYVFSCPDSSKANYPLDALPVAKWALSEFGARSRVAASFLTHAIVNENAQVLTSYLMKMNEPNFSSFKIELQVPVTLKHFQILARLGRAPSYHMYHCIEYGAEFHLDENSYISASNPAKGLVSPKAVKTEPSSLVLPSRSPSSSSSPSSSKVPIKSPSARGRKRPRRLAATTVRSYAVPDSDDDVTMDFPPEPDQQGWKVAVGVKSSLQSWINYLTELQKQEQKRHKDHKKRLEAMTGCGPRTRLVKTPFLKSLTSNLRALRKVEAEARAKLGLPEDNEVIEPGYDDDDGEYILPASKRRKLHWSS
ncbi:hypothetical protein BKA70DRAFT_1559177 [Coprinopsis sp. MPI-PUGE-AT-0042]|nr:hypothetical protein BKA70DRAFT_1559177 [Coprinopsis sp. MPI-PUGE-AT-0042]